MLSLQRILMDLSPMFIAILIGILVYKRLPVFYRILFFQVLSFIAIDIYATTIKNNNAWLYNIEMIIEISLIFLAAYSYFNKVLSKRILIILFSLFLCILFINFYFYPSNMLSNYAYITGGILITGIYLTILFSHFYIRKDDYLTAPLVISGLGIVLYFAGTIPYLSMMYSLQKKDAHFNQSLFQTIVVALAFIRYLFLAIAFFLLGKFQFNAFNKPANDRS